MKIEMYEGCRVMGIFFFAGKSFTMTEVCPCELLLLRLIRPILSRAFSVVREYVQHDSFIPQIETFFRVIGSHLRRANSPLTTGI